MPGNRQWTSKEDALARKLRKQGKTYKEIAKILDRTEAAVCQRLTSNVPVNTDLDEIALLSRTKLKFVPGAIYEIDNIFNSRGLEFLPAKFRFIREIEGENCILYLFQSIKGGYFITFTYGQIVSSYVFYKVEEEQ